MKIKDYFVNEYNALTDCILGLEFISLSQQIPSKINCGIKCNSKVRCVIKKNCDFQLINVKINELTQKQLKPHYSIGDYLSAGEIIIINSKINKLKRHEPDPISIGKKVGKVHRIQIANISTEDKFSIGFIVMQTGLSQTISLTENISLSEMIKLNNN
jgi:hypothetical protein